MHTRLKNLPLGERSMLRSRHLWVPSLLIVGSFTPYIGVPLDIRWEHFLAYGALLIVIASGRLASSGTLAVARPLLVPWLMLTVLVLVSTGLRLTSQTGAFPVLRLLAVLDSFLLPVALVLASGAFAAADPRLWELQVRRAAGVLVVLASINSLLIVSFPVEQVDWLVRQFWANPLSAGPRGTVADRALTMGRYGGIFNQPYDGGLAYTLALMAWAYLFVLNRRSSMRQLLPAFILLALLVVGGVSADSKVFYFGSVLVASFTVLVTRASQRSRLKRLMQTGTIASLGLIAVIATEVAAFDRMLRVLGAVGSDARVVSGGRWNSFPEYLQTLLSSISLFGQGWSGAQDDALMAYLVGGGVVGVLAIVSVYAVLLRLPSRLPTRIDEGSLLSGLTIIMLGASFGAISLQVNRASSIYWIFVGLAIGHRAKTWRIRAQRATTSGHEVKN